MVPAAADWMASEDVDHYTYGRGDRDVADGEEAYYAVGRLWSETQVEEQHGELGQREAGRAEHDRGVANL